MKQKTMLKTALKVVKIVGGVTISIGVGAIVRNLVTVTTPQDVKRVTDVCIKVGSFFVAGMVAADASDRFMSQVDSIVDAVGGVSDSEENDEKIFVVM